MFAVYFYISFIMSGNFSILICYGICNLARSSYHPSIINVHIFIILQLVEFTLIPSGSFYILSYLPCY